MNAVQVIETLFLRSGAGWGVCEPSSFVSAPVDCIHVAATNGLTYETACEATA